MCTGTTAAHGWRRPSFPLPTLRRGEILGIAGIVGAGRTELLRTIFGLEPVRSGRVRVAAAEAAGRPTPRRRLAEGVGLLSEDRKQEGLALGLSITDNLTLSRLEPYTRAGVLSDARRRAATRRWADELSIRLDDPD